MKELTEENSKDNVQQLEVQSPLTQPKSDGIKIKYVIMIMGITLIIVAIIILLIILFIIKEEEIDNWDISYKKAENFINKLNLTEKINLLFGTQNMKGSSIIIEDESEKEFLCVGQIDPFKNEKVNFKGMCLQDGPAGVRFANGTSISWQAAINTAATFNKNLMYEIGRAQGKENRIKGINAFLAPCANMMRSPQGGRVWEAFGDDPFYTGICASQVIKGIQKEGVIATIKHFVGNDQETYRKASSSNMDKQTLMDIYVEPFYRAIHDGNVGAIMSGYNAINNIYCDENHFILTDVLRGILNFKGFVMSDWWGVYSNHTNTINSGLDMNMPGGKGYGPFDEKRKYDYYGRSNSYWSYLEKDIEKNRVKETKVKKKVENNKLAA